MKITKNSFFKKLLPVAVVGAGLAVAGTALASTTEKARVTDIRVAGGKVSFGLNKDSDSNPCGGSRSNRYWFEYSVTDGEAWLNLITAAKLSGTPVSVYGTGSGCLGAEGMETVKQINLE